MTLVIHDCLYSSRKRAKQVALYSFVGRAAGAVEICIGMMIAEGHALAPLVFLLLDEEGIERHGTVANGALPSVRQPGLWVLPLPIGPTGGGLAGLERILCGPPRDLTRVLALTKHGRLCANVGIPELGHRGANVALAREVLLSSPSASSRAAP